MIVEIRGNRGHQKNMAHLINQVGHICAYKDGSGKHRAYMGLQSVLLACAVDDRLVVLWDCACRWDSDSFACSWDSFSPAGFPCPTSMWGLYPCLIVCGFVVYLHFGCCLLETCSKGEEDGADTKERDREVCMEGVEEEKSLVGM